MKKYIIDLGYVYSDKDDVNDKEFTLVSSNIQDDEELTTMGNVRYILDYTYKLFLKNSSYNEISFAEKMKLLKDSLYDKSLTPLDNNKIYYLDRFDNDVLKVENGYNIEMKFTLRG